MNEKPLGPSARDIIYFEQEANPEQLGQNIIKNYLNYLKYYKLKGPFRFCFVQRDYELIESLTLKENMYLDSVPLSLTSSREDHFKRHLKEGPNPFLNKLINGISELDAYPGQVDPRARKMLGLIKSLMQDVDYLFLDHPEKHLAPDDLRLFIDALTYHIGQTKKTVLLSSEHQGLWLPHATKKACRSNCKGFQTLQILKDRVQQSFLRSEHAVQINTQDEDGLVIDLGKWAGKKAA